MNNNVGVTNTFGFGGESLILILFLLLFLSPGAIGGCGNDSFLILILFLLILMPNFNRGVC